MIYFELILMQIIRYYDVCNYWAILNIAWMCSWLYSSGTAGMENISYDVNISPFRNVIYLKYSLFVNSVCMLFPFIIINPFSLTISRWTSLSWRMVWCPAPRVPGASRVVEEGRGGVYAPELREASVKYWYSWFAVSVIALSVLLLIRQMVRY